MAHLTNSGTGGIVVLNLNSGASGTRSALFQAAAEFKMAPK